MLQYSMDYTIEEDNLIHLQRFKTNPPNPSYIAGFIDGDGCIFIRKIKDGYQSGFTVTQTRTNILQVLRYHFGGSITSSVNRNNKTVDTLDDLNNYHKHNIRNQYNLIIRSNEYQLLLQYLQNSFVIKESQYNCLYEFNKLINLQNMQDKKEELYNKCSQFNKHIIHKNIYYENINIQYIAGLFDAEGCIYISHKKLSKFYISLTQKNNPDVLMYILKLLQFGNIDSEKKFKIYNKNDCLKFILLIKSYLIVKYNQANAFETFLNTTDTTLKQQMYQICNKEKHQIEVFNNLNQNNNNKEGYLKHKETKETKEIEETVILKEQLDNSQEDCKPVYKKIVSEETKKKMSVSIRDAKDGVSDEDIIKVRDLIKEGYKNIDIQTSLNLPRHTITRIKNGKLVCRDEEKINKQILNQEQLNISKRKITCEEILKVIEKCIENWKPSKILDYLIEKRTQSHIENTLTIDIIKNIKRNLKNKKNVIYESELTKEMYVYYINLLQQFK